MGLKAALQNDKSVFDADRLQNVTGIMLLQPCIFVLSDVHARSLSQLLSFLLNIISFELHFPVRQCFLLKMFLKDRELNFLMRSFLIKCHAPKLL